MIRQIWLNLPSKNLSRSREFFTALGFRVNEKHSNENMLALFVGANNFPVMICEDRQFAKYAMQEPWYGAPSSEMLISFDAESRDEVEEIAAKALAAGGQLFSKPADVMGWMYGCAFADPDGHRWNVLFMDPDKRV